MSIYAIKTPYRDQLRADRHICNRCGIQVIRNADRWHGYCVDCKTYAINDGLMEAAA